MASNSSTSGRASPLISISVVSHGDAGALGILLESLARNEPADKIQLIVTDNLGRDLHDVPAAGWHSVVMHRPTRPLGFARNHNAALHAAAGDFYCVLNPDVVFRMGVLPRLIERLEQGQAQIAAPLIVDSLGHVQDSFRDLPSPWELVVRRAEGRSRVPEPPPGALVRPDWIAGTFMLMRREVFSHLGGFDPRYHLYFEDVDLCTRARLMGYAILVDAGLRLEHDPRRASRRAPKYLRWHLESALRFFASGVYWRGKKLRAHA